MHTPLNPYRMLSICALAAACVGVLSGCAVLQGNAEQGASGKPVVATGAETGASGKPVVATGAETGPSGQPATGPSWNLQTLESLSATGAPAILTFERAWQLATLHDPDYQAALSGRAAAQTESRQGLSALLPQVQAGYVKNRISGLQRNYVGALMREGELAYDSSSAYIQLRQPLFNVDRYARFQRGHARVRLGEAEFAQREAEAALRLAEAFLGAVEARGRSELAHSLADSLQAQATAQDALYRRNEASRVDMQETRARLALARAEAIAADDALRVAYRRLQALIGQEPPALAGIDHLKVEPHLQADSLIQWLDLSLANGPAVRSAVARLSVADTDVRSAHGRHLPTADLVVAFSDADSENLDTLSQRSNTLTVGVQMSMPIFSGGYDTAEQARTRHLRVQAGHELALAREQVAAEVTRQYTAVESGARRIESLLSSVNAGEESLAAARKGYEYGVNSNLDVLRRQDTLFRARYELLHARVGWLTARVALAAAAGEAPARVFGVLDRLLAP